LPLPFDHDFCGRLVRVTKTQGLAEQFLRLLARSRPRVEGILSTRRGDPVAENTKVSIMLLHGPILLNPTVVFEDYTTDTTPFADTGSA
jgi:hypothetical protein